MAIINTGSGAPGTMRVDSTPEAARVVLYGADGQPIAKASATGGNVTPGTTTGLLLAAAEGKNSKLVRAASDGSIFGGTERSLLVYDNVEGAAVDTNKWIQTLTTMTITQATGVITLNAGSSVASTVGAMLTTHRQMFLPARGMLVFQSRQRHTAHFINNLIEVGFGSPASATVAPIGNGAVWRKDGTGQYVPVLAINGAEYLGTPIDNATFLAQIMATEYAIFEVILETGSATFNIYKATGELVFSETLDFAAASLWFTVTHVKGMMRTYNAAATGTAVQVLINQTAYWFTDGNTNRSWGEQMAGHSYGGPLTSPTAYTQLEAYTNNAAPTTATPSNTAAASATLGGVVGWSNGANSFAASDTLDLIIFGAAVPSPYGLVLTGIRIDSINLGAANGAAIYAVQWFLAVNSSAVSLATGTPYFPMRKALGFQTLGNAAAIGTAFAPVIDMNFSPIYVFPGRFVVVGARVIGASAATASQVIRTAASLRGYFE